MVKKQIPKEPNQNNSATPECERLPSFRKSLKSEETLEHKLYFEDFWLHFILLWHGLYLFSNGFFCFVFLGKFFVSFSNYEAEFLFSTMLYVIVFKTDVWTYVRKCQKLIY